MELVGSIFTVSVPSFLCLEFTAFLPIFPGSLERMMGSHNQSMFEYLAPRRGGGAHVQQQQQQHHQQQQQQQQRQAQEGYKDMVY